MFGLFENKKEKSEKLIKKGIAAMAAGSFTSAESCFLKAIELDIFNATDAWIGLGSLYLSTASNDKAKSCFETAVDQRRDDFHAIRGLALAEKALGHDEASIKCFKQLVDKFDYKPDDDPIIKPADRNWLASYGI
jgi:Tfp pilus assembly protein PilF